MNKLLFFAYILILTQGCKNNENPSEIHSMEKPVILNNKSIEKLTKTYSVKIIDGLANKDTVNMIQSLVFDENGNEMANIFYNLDGTVNWKDEYIYDKRGFKVGSNYFEGGKEQTSYYEYDLDSLGRKVGFRALEIKTDKLLYDGVSKFEKGGKIRKDDFLNKAGEFIYNFEYQFDDNGNEIGYTYIDLSSGKKYPSKYKCTKFNSNKEWIERQIIENNQITSIELQEFKINK